MLSEQVWVCGPGGLWITWRCEHRAVWRGRSRGLGCHLLIRRQLQRRQEAEVEHGRWVGAGAVIGQQTDLPLPLLLLHSEFGSSVSIRTTAAKEDQHGPQQPEPPELVVVCAAAGFSAAVSGFTQVSSISISPWAVAWSPQQGQATTRVVLHCTPAPQHLHLRHRYG